VKHLHPIITAALAVAVVVLLLREPAKPSAELRELQSQVKANARAIGDLTEAVGSLAETTQQTQAKIDAAKDAIDELTREAL